MSICLWIAAMQFVTAQELILSIPHKMVYEDDSLSLDMLVIDFDSIVSTQFSMSWDPEIIRYLGFSNADLDLVAVGANDAEDGSIRVSWFDIDGEGKSLQDGQNFVSLHFQAIGKVGDSTPVTINGDSLMIQVFQATGIPTLFDSIGLVTEDGFVEIFEDIGPQNTFAITNSNVTDVACANSETGAIQIEANQTNLLYNWSGPNGFSSDMQNIDNLIAGEYILTVTDSLGVVLLDSTFQILQPLSELILEDILSTASACDAATGSVNFELLGGEEPFQVILDSGQQFDQNNVSDLSAGNYMATVTDANGCSIEASFVIEQSDSFDFSLGEDINACIGESVTILAGEFSTYTWSNATEESSIAVDESGEYSVIVTNETGCTATDTINLVFIEEVSLQFNQQDVITCPGDSITLNISGGINYEWIDPNNELTQTQGNSIVVSPNENTIYTVISESNCGSDELDIPVEVYTITATAGEDVCVPLGDAATLNASGGEFYYWSGAEYPLDAYDIQSPTSFPEDSTQYFVMIIDQNECITFDTVAVFIGDDPVSFIPHINLISPNGDGINDAIDFGDISKFGVNTFRVFNRWGKIVYEKINYQSDESRFSGMFNGSELPAGNYYYVLSFSNDQEIKQTLCIVKE